MKKILLILALLCVSLQAQTYQFESATTASSGITTVTAREKTGWTSDGTTAQDTLATVYRLDKANVRFIVTDADGDTLWFYPQNLLPFVLKDGTTILAAIDSTGRAGFGTSTSGQARRAILNVASRAGGDTTAIFTGESNYGIGDSTTYILGNGALSVANGITARSGHINISSAGHSLLLAGVNALSILGGGGAALALGSGFPRSSVVGSIGLGSFFVFDASSRWQAIATVRAGSVSSDTLFMVRNDWNTTLDSTMMVFANGDGYFGGNNLYIGGHRIRSNAAGDSLIFYDGTTMIFAILSDGSTADLVAGVPPLRRYIPPPDVIWLLRIGILLLLLLVAFKIHDYLKPVIRKHKTLPGEI